MIDKITNKKPVEESEEAKKARINTEIKVLLTKPINAIIAIGYGAAISGKLDYIDHVVIPAYMQKPFSQNVDRRELDGMSALPRAFLKRVDLRVRNYGATLLGAYFCSAAPGIEPDETVMGTLESIAKELSTLALHDPQIWPRFRASIALMHAKEYCDAPFVAGIIKPEYPILRTNLREGMERDRKLAKKTNQYIAYLDGKANTLPFIA